MEKWLWLSAGAAIGWIATQFGHLASDVVRRYLLKRAVVSELRQIHEESRRVWTSLARSLQMHSLGLIDNSLPLSLSNKAYSNHYGEALLVFTRVQRIAIELIHKYVEEVNSGLVDLRSSINRLNDDYYESTLDQVQLVRFGHKLKSIMSISAEIMWYTNYYMSRPNFPILETSGPQLEVYQKYVDSYREEIEKTIASVKGLTREDFEKAYRPSSPPVTDDQGKGSV